MADTSQEAVIARSPWRARRLALLLLVGVVVVVAALAYREFWWTRPVGRGPAGPTVPRAPFEQVWTRRPVLLLGLGDSITAGLGAHTPARSFFRRLVENPPDEFPELEGICLRAVLPNLTVRNLAISGTTSLDHLDTLPRFLEMQPADTLGLVVLTTGGNDLIHWYGRRPPREGAMYGATRAEAEPWINAFATRLHRLLDLIEARFPGGCHIFLADIYDPTDGVGDAPSAYLPDWPDGLAIHAAYNQMIRAAAEQRANVHLVPLRATFLGHGTHCRQFWRATYCADDPTFWFYDNIEDPNDRGHDAVRRAFLIEMAKLGPGWAE